jgi:hypothetical protein
MKKIVIMGLVSIASLSAFAQKKEIKKEIKTEVTDSDKPGKKKIRIEENVNGKVTITEKEIDIKDMKEGDVNISILDDNLDTLINDHKGQKRVKVIVKDENDEDFEWYEEDSDRGAMDKHVRIRKSFPNDKFQEFNFDFDRLHEQLADIPNRFRGMRPYEFDDRIMKAMEPSTIRGLDVFTNRPETNVLNIRFFAPKSGDVNITVLDLQGDVKAKESAKNFEGEYVGQIKLNKSIKGTFFVIVSQGEDGISRKVKID